MDALVGGLLLACLAGVFAADLEAAGVFFTDFGVSAFFVVFLPVDLPTLLLSLLTTLPSFSTDSYTGSMCAFIGDLAGEEGFTDDWAGEESLFGGECLPVDLGSYA
jgi:hypothetical protein